MKLFFATLVAMLATAATTSAQTQEVSLWSRNTGIYPWYFYTGRVVVVDARFNFDEKKTLAGCLGKKFGGKVLNIIPEVCGYAGQENGYGPELWVLHDSKKYSVMSYVQYARFLKAPAFGYAWFQTEMKISWLGIGVAGQATKEKQGTLDVDFGPSVKINFGRKIHLGVMPMLRVTPTGRMEKTVFLNLAYMF